LGHTALILLGKLLMWARKTDHVGAQLITWARKLERKPITG